MGFLIDTSVLIAAERGRFSLADLVRNLAGEPLALAAITASELLHGVHRAVEPNVAEKRSRFVEYILDLFPVLPFDLETARVHAELWVALQRGGQVIGAHDLIIAATARAADYGLITANSAEFQRVPGLTVINPLA
jgi:tRNA(fMet)-specific endonuclease VapC